MIVTCCVGRHGAQVGGSKSMIMNGLRGIFAKTLNTSFLAWKKQHPCLQLSNCLHLSKAQPTIVASLTDLYVVRRKHAYGPTIIKPTLDNGIVQPTGYFNTRHGFLRLIRFTGVGARGADHERTYNESCPQPTGGRMEPILPDERAPSRTLWPARKPRR